jgi:uncharacterized glyoxalase superfamily protein PhnB
MLSFYSDVLGLRMNNGVHPGKGNDPRANWARLKPSGLSDGAAIELFAESRQRQPSAIPFPRNNSIVLAFKVEKVLQTNEELTARGVDFQKPVGEEEWSWYGHSNDPEGNGLQIYQPNRDSEEDST